MLDIFYNPGWILLPIAVATALSSQFMKFVITSVREKRLIWRMLTTDGGMPSSHSAAAASLFTGVFLIEGASMLFWVVLVMSGFIIRDATGIRRAAGRHAHIINELMEKENLHEKHVKELLGHTPLQAFLGVVWGIFVAWLVFSLCML